MPHLHNRTWALTVRLAVHREKGMKITVVLTMLGLMLPFMAGAQDSAGQNVAQGVKFEFGTTLNIVLSDTVDARKCKPGDIIKAKASEDVKAGGIVVIPRGAKLIGHVTEAQPAAKTGEQARLGFAFDRADLKDGRHIALHTAFYALAAPQGASSDSMGGGFGGGFGGAGVPEELIDALIAQGAKDLTIVNNNAGNAEFGVAALLKAGRVRRIVCSYPRTADSYVFDALYRAGKIELELVPQGTLSERMRAAGAGIGAFYTPTGYGTDLAKGKETRTIEGKGCVLEHPLCGDVALVKAERGDRWGNLVYRKSARNFGPTMASAAKCTIAQVYETVELGALDPECIVTPGIFVTRVVKVPRKEGGNRVPAGGVTRGISGRAAV